MSWSVSVTGDDVKIGEAFDAEKKRSADNGMIPDEQLDIDEARDFAMQIASVHGECAVSASGHWTVFGPNDSRNEFGAVQVNVQKVAS